MGSEDWRPESLLRSIERSLRRLRTDHLDLVQLHTCSEAELRKGDVIGALETARERGWTRYVGYSGDSQAARYAIECGRFDTLQTSVSIADQEALELTLPLARQRGVGVIAKRPLANVAWRHQGKPDNAYHHTYWERLRKLDYDFLHGDQAVATALRFTLSVPGVATAIVGTTRPGRWRQNAALLEAGPLSAAQFDRVRDRWFQVADPSWTGQG
jgi:aryl-alcohol dehydrogenase-like predicted oxidoreductase